MNREQESTEEADFEDVLDKGRSDEIRNDQYLVPHLQNLNNEQRSQKATQKVKKGSQIAPMNVEEEPQTLEEWNEIYLDKNHKQFPEAHLRSIVKEKINRMKLTINEVNNYSQEGLIGGDSTHLALKNPKSFLIGTSRKGIKVFENDAQIFSGRLSRDGHDELYDAVYIASLTSYFLLSDSRIYRKDICTNPPHLFMSFNNDSKNCTFLRFSTIHQRLLITRDGKDISIINPRTRKIEVVFSKRVGKKIKDFQLIGELEDRGVTVTEYGYIVLYSLIFGKKRGFMTFYNCRLVQEGDGYPQSIAVCDKNQYLFVLIAPKYNYLSRVIILKLTNGSRLHAASAVKCSQNIGRNFACEIYGYIGSHILFFGLSRKKNGLVKIYGFDTEKGKWNELIGKKMTHKQHKPLRMHRLGDKFYYTGNLGKLLVLSLNV